MPKLFMIPCALEIGMEQQMLTPQLKDVLRNTDTFFVENIRSARRFISACKLDIDISSLKFEILDKKTSKDKVRSFFKKYPETSIGIISEAGCPGIADPGALATGIAHDLSYEIIPLIGPSSLLLALMASGLNGQKFEFHGYLPIKQFELVPTLKSIENQINKTQSAHIFIETPYRNNQLFESIINNCTPTLDLTIAADISGTNQEILTRNIKDWRIKKPELHKRPVVFILGKRL